VKTFRIGPDGDIAAFEGGKAAGALAAGTEAFRSERELHDITAAWLLDRLVQVWNRQPGAQRVKRFRDRQTAVARIWKAVQNLKPSSAKDEGTPRPHDPKPLPQTRRQKTGKGHTITRVAQVIQMLEQPGGATLRAIISATGWQAHSVRGLISGHLRKKLGLRVKSFQRDGERAYAIRARNQIAVEIVKTTKKGKRKR